MLLRDVEQLRNEVAELSRDTLLADLQDLPPELLDDTREEEYAVTSHRSFHNPIKPKKYSLWLTRDDHGNHGIGNGHSGKHVVYLDFSHSDLNLGNPVHPVMRVAYQAESDESDLFCESVGKYASDIIVGDTDEIFVAHHLEHDPGVKIEGGQFYNPFVKNASNHKTYQKLFKQSNTLALMLETILTHDLKGCANIINYQRAHETVKFLLNHLIHLSEVIIDKMAIVDRHHVRMELFYEVGENPSTKFEPCSFGMNGLYHGLPFYPGPKFSNANQSFITRAIKAVRQSEYFVMVRGELQGSIDVLKQFYLQLAQVPKGGRLKINDENKAVRGGIVIALEILLACIDRANFSPKNLNQFLRRKKLNPLQVPTDAWVKLENNDPSIFNQIFGFDSQLVVHRRHMTRSHLNSQRNRGYEYKNARLSVTRELMAKVRDPISANITTGLIDRAFFLYSKGVENNTHIANKPISLFFCLDSAELPGLDELPRVESLIATVAQCAYDCLRRENSQTVSALSHSKVGKEGISPDKVPYNEQDAITLKQQLRNRCPIQLATMADLRGSKISLKRSRRGNGYCIDSAGMFYIPFFF